MTDNGTSNAKTLRSTREANGSWWVVTCALLVIPFAAMLHHIVFYTGRCMLNDFGVTEYTPVALWRWLSRDPSLPWAIVAANVVYFGGQKFSWIKFAAPRFFLAFLPLSIWIWDIPFTQRYICRHFHDNHLLVFGIAVRATHFYVLGLILTAGFCLAGLIRSRRSSARP
ncbi:MAG TPA: hypothetical protein VKX17_10145 [Planctomycetota bacterium]|nr:hypothetical protein [Planctomycetota bacterium]